MKVIPPEVIENVVEILYYVASAAIGWIAKWLTGKKNKKDDSVPQS